jgi:hypothetical protein
MRNKILFALIVALTVLASCGGKDNGIPYDKYELAEYDSCIVVGLMRDEGRTILQLSDYKTNQHSLVEVSNKTFSEHSLGDTIHCNIQESEVPSETVYDETIYAKKTIDGKEYVIAIKISIE